MDKSTFSDICQIRLDFDNMDITEEATPTGACLDSFTMDGPTIRDPQSLCGTNTGMHGMDHRYCKIF